MGWVGWVGMLGVRGGVGRDVLGWGVVWVLELSWGEVVGVGRGYGTVG